MQDRCSSGRKCLGMGMTTPFKKQWGNVANGGRTSRRLAIYQQDYHLTRSFACHILLLGLALLAIPDFVVLFQFCRWYIAAVASAAEDLDALTYCLQSYVYTFMYRYTMDSTYTKESLQRLYSLRTLARQSSLLFSCKLYTLDTLDLFFFHLFFLILYFIIIASGRLIF